MDHDQERDTAEERYAEGLMRDESELDADERPPLEYPNDLAHSIAKGMGLHTRRPRARRSPPPN